MSYQIGDYVLYTSANMGEANNTLGMVVDCGVECIDPEIVEDLNRNNVCVMCQWENIDDVSPYFPPSDNDMRDLINAGFVLPRELRILLARRDDAASTALIDLHFEKFDEF